MSHAGILPSNPDWKQLYRSAMFELDSTELPQQIAKARQAMLERAKEIFNKTGDNEFHALCDGLRALRLLEEEVAPSEQPAA